MQQFFFLSTIFRLNFGTVLTVVFLCFGTVLTVWYFFVLELFWQWYFFVLELFWRCGISLFLELFWQCGISLSWNCSDSVVFLCFGTVLTVWYFFVLELFWQCGISLFFSSFYDKRAQITHAIFRHPLSNNLFNSELLFIYPKISLLLIIMLHREYKHNTVRLQYNVTINKV